MKNNVRVYFDTMLGNIIVDGRVETNFAEYISKLDEKDTFKEIECSLFIKTQIAGSPMPKERELTLGYVVYRDLLAIKKANEESDERHQVDMSTLEIWRISIDREFLRITWTFDDGTGGRIICGNPNVIHERDERRDESWHVYPVQKFQVAW